MLISQKDISNSQAPFIMQTPTGDWKLVLNIVNTNQQLKLTVIEQNEDSLTKRWIELDELPFHIGEGIWELEYGVTLKTLQHPSEASHPAHQLWKNWLTKNHSNV